MATEQKQRGTLINILDLDPMECSRGINFDPDVLYTFTITGVEARKLEKETNGHKKEFIIVDAQCTEQESKATIRMSFFHNQKITFNDENRLRETDIVKFARGLGFQIGLGKKFSMSEIVREGARFQAHVKPQVNNEGKPSGYNEIDLMTVKGIGGASQKQAQSTIAGSPEDEEFLVGVAAGYPNKEKMINGLREMKRMDLINLMMTLDSQGKLKYAAQ